VRVMRGLVDLAWAVRLRLRARRPPWRDDRWGERFLRLVLAAVGALVRRLWWTARVSFARRGLLGKGVYLTVALFGLAWLSAHAGLHGLAVSLTHGATTVLSVLLAAAFMKLIWLKFTEPHRGLRR